MVAGFLVIFPDGATPNFFGDGNNHTAEKFAVDTAPKIFVNQPPALRLEGLRVAEFSSLTLKRSLEKQAWR